jgi:DNA polymerase-3 subunit delta
MILKPYQLVNMKSKTSNYYLFYGQNEGQKNEVIQKIINDKFTKNIYRYDEDEILNNYDNLLNELSNKSFFEDKKMLIISRVTDKIISFIEDVKERNIRDIKIIINSKALDKKSKLRASFEKDKELVCVAFYHDDNSTLSNIASKFFNEKKIPISREIINVLVERCRGDRINLSNEISKIENFLLDKDKISFNEILKLTNLAENYSFSELADACLSNNKKKTLLIINENNFSADDCIAIIRIFLNKAKRIFALKKMEQENKSIEECLTSYKPPIFWKDKEVVRKQIKHWSLERIQKLIFFVNELELLMKKENTISVYLLNDFILDQVRISN